MSRTDVPGPRARWPAGSLLGVRAVRHGVAATAAMLVACAAVAAMSLIGLATATGGLAPLTARAQAELTPVDGTAVAARWRLPDGRPATARVPMAGSAPKGGTRSAVAYDPAHPEHAVVPGAAVLAQADRCASGLAFTGVVALAVVTVFGARLITRARLPRRPAGPVALRRVRVQSGLLVRSWLETEQSPQRWIPVYFDPVLVALPSPSVVTLYGDPLRDRLVAAEVGGVLLAPSGRVARAEPRGRRIDNPARPDQHAAARAASASRWSRQLHSDAALLLPAPVVGLFGAYVAGGGATVWLATTVITAAFGLWWAALRGCDPS